MSQKAKGQHGAVIFQNVRSSEIRHLGPNIVKQVSRGLWRHGVQQLETARLREFLFFCIVSFGHTVCVAKQGFLMTDLHLHRAVCATCKGAD